MLRSKFLEEGDSQEVQALAAIGLARMNANEILPDIRAQLTGTEEYNEFRFGCALALKHLTGEPIPVWKFSQIGRIDQPTFLEPLGP